MNTLDKKHHCKSIEKEILALLTTLQCAKPNEHINKARKYSYEALRLTQLVATEIAKYDVRYK